MKNLKHIVEIFLILGIAMILSGCNESYAQKKQAMEAHWEMSKAQAKLPLVEDMISRGNLKEAKETLNKCLSADPGNSQVHLLIGRIHFIEGRTDKARQSFQKSVELDPHFSPGWYSLGSLTVLEKDYPLAMEQYQKALQLNPANAEYLISVCELYIEMDQMDRARDVIQDGLSKQPNSLELMLTMARLYQRSGDYVKAIQVYEQAQLMHGKVPQILEPCGYAYTAVGRWAKAAEKFELLLDQYKSDTEHSNVTLRSLAMCSFNAGDYGRALTCYDKLSVVYRDDPEIWVAMAQSALGLNDTKRAIRCADKALQLKPAWSEAYAVLASAQYMQGQYEKSLDTFHVINNDEQLSGFAWFMIGRCYRQMGQTAEAESAFERAEQLDPDSDLVTAFLKKTVQPL